MPFVWLFFLFFARISSCRGESQWATSHVSIQRGFLARLRKVIPLAVCIVCLSECKNRVPARFSEPLAEFLVICRGFGADVIRLLAVRLDLLLR